MRARLTKALLVVMLTACTRSVQVWPTPIDTGASVRVRFNPPRTLALEGAAQPRLVSAVRELRGHVVSINHDTLLVQVSRVRTGVAEDTLVSGREVRVVLDQFAHVITSEPDSWKFAYLLLSGVVLVFAGGVLLSD